MPAGPWGWLMEEGLTQCSGSPVVWMQCAPVPQHKCLTSADESSGSLAVDKLATFSRSAECYWARRSDERPVVITDGEIKQTRTTADCTSAPTTPHPRPSPSWTSTDSHYTLLHSLPRRDTRFSLQTPSQGHPRSPNIRLSHQSSFRRHQVSSFLLLPPDSES